MKKLFAVLALIGILTTSAFAKQHVETKNINRFFDLVSLLQHQMLIRL